MGVQSANLRDRLKLLLTKTESVEGEVELFFQYCNREPLGLAWCRAVKRGIHSPTDSKEQILAERGLVRKILKLLNGVLVPQIDNFTSPQRTPWGGTEILQQYKKLHGIHTEDIIGESWEISGHLSFPNTFKIKYGGKELQISIHLLEEWANHLLYGGSAGHPKHSSMPFLVKLLNSGSWKPYLDELNQIFKDYIDLSLEPEWCEDLSISSFQDICYQNYHEIHHSLTYLESAFAEKRSERSREMMEELEVVHQKMIERNLSIQVHPKDQDYPDKPSKTEAWIILDTEKGAGLYLGLRQGVTESEFETQMRSGKDVSYLMNFVEVQPGDVFFIPAGTLHSIGAGVLLIEPQETSEVTFRAYDWGRLYDGKPRDLHYDETINVTTWDGPRGNACVNMLRQTPHAEECSNSHVIVESLVAVKEFHYQRVTFPSSGDCYKDPSQLFTAFFVSNGSVEVFSGDEHKSIGIFKKGQSFMLPTCIHGSFLAAKENGSVVFQTYTP